MISLTIDKTHHNEYCRNTEFLTPLSTAAVEQRLANGAWEALIKLTCEASALN